MGLLSAIGNGFNSYLDRGISGSLAGVPAGLLNLQTGQGPTQEGVAPMMTPQDRHALRMNYLMHLGQGLQMGSPTAKMDDFRNDVVNSAVMGQQIRQQQAQQAAAANIFGNPNATAPLNGAPTPTGAPAVGPGDGAAVSTPVIPASASSAVAPLGGVTAPQSAPLPKPGDAYRKYAVLMSIKGQPEAASKYTEIADKLDAPDPSKKNQGAPIILSQGGKSILHQPTEVGPGVDTPFDPSLKDIAETTNYGASTKKSNADAAEAQQRQKKLELDYLAQRAQDPNMNQDVWGHLRSGASSDLQAQMPAMFSPKAAAALQAMGVSPDKTAELAAAATAAKNPKINTPAELAYTATDPTLTDQQRADAGLKRLNAYQQAGRPITNNVLPGLTPQAGDAATGDAYLGTLSPSLAAQVKAIAEGRSTMPSAATRSVAAIQLRDAVFHFDPTYSDQRAQIRKSFTTGPDGRNVGNLNTATVHLGQLADASEALKNGSFQPGNAAYNYIATKFGAPAATNQKFVLNALAGEAAAAMKGNATDPEIAAMVASLNKGDMSPDQALGVTKSALHVFGAKLNTYRERYEQQSPNDQVYSPVMPSAKAVFDKYNVAATPGGGAKVYTQANVDAAVRSHPGLTAAQAEQAFQSRGWVKK